MLLGVIATLCAFFIKGLCGFANTLVFTSILSFGNSNINISPIELILSYPSNLLMAFRERKSINWKLCLTLSALVIIGSVPGALLLKSADAVGIKIIFGVVIILIGIEMLIREIRAKKVKESKIVLGIVGILSGILCGLYGVGALLGAYISRVTDDSCSFRSNICVVFTIENTFRIILYSVWGIITFDSLKSAVILLPVMLAGLGLGILTSKVMNDKVVKKVVLVMLIVSGCALIINNI